MTLPGVSFVKRGSGLEVADAESDGGDAWCHNVFESWSAIRDGGILVHPVPPLEAFWLGRRLGSEINRTTKNVKHTPVLMLAAQCAKLLVKTLGATATQSRNSINAQVGQIACKTRTHSGNA